MTEDKFAKVVKWKRAADLETFYEGSPPPDPEWVIAKIHNDEADKSGSQDYRIEPKKKKTNEEPTT